MSHAFRASLALLAGACLAAGAQQPSAPTTPVAGIVAPNVRVISPLLVTAGQPDRASLQRLKAEGYAAVISLAPGNTTDAIPDQAEILAAQGVEFVHIPIPWQTPEAKHLDAMAAAMQRLKGKKVLVHCQMNMRASAITFLYRTIYEKEDPAKAWGDVKALWTPTDQWAEFIKGQLRAHGIAFEAM
ncbi:MAG: protein tyrosine phosphatase family protein [Pseudomonadota bacterium]